MIEFILNDQKISTDNPSGALLLDFIRYEKALTGTKVGCREGDCGACTVLIGSLENEDIQYQQITSCLVPLGNVHGKHVVTIEGLNLESLSPVQQQLVDASGTQCGFCTVGFVVSLSGYCLSKAKPSYAEAIASIDGNICRCTGYKSIERAAQQIVHSIQDMDPSNTLDWLVKNKFIPSYFKRIPNRLKEIPPLESSGTEYQIVGGGTDLYVQKPDTLVQNKIRPLGLNQALRFVHIENDLCKIGGATTMTDLLNSKDFNRLFPRFPAHAKLISSTPIRNMSTLAGNFVNASPIGDMTAFFLALDARITLEENKKVRGIPLKEFYRGYKTLDKSTNEIISSVSFPVPSVESHFNFEKVSKRTHLDIASVNSAAQIRLLDGQINEVHLSAGGVAPIPLYLHETCAYLNGREVSVRTIHEASQILQEEISPISDVRGTMEYKRLLIRQLFYAHFVTLFPQQITFPELL
jgi:xanthine dehydrogenase small subunit